MRQKRKRLFDLPCWECDGKTSAGYYPDPGNEHLFCFKCKAIQRDPDFINEFLSLKGFQKVSDSKTILDPDSRIPNNNNDVGSMLSGLLKTATSKIEGIPERGIKRETCLKFGVETLYDANLGLLGHSFSFPGSSTDSGGDFGIVATKVKFDLKFSDEDHPKKHMKIRGDFKQALLFGMNVVSKGGKYITITEGEEDCLAAYQMLKSANPSYEPSVISIGRGATGALQDCKNTWEFLNSFENIIICFDSDKEGRKAALACADLFPQKAKIVKLGLELKDANEYLLQGRNREFIDLWYKAEKVMPEGVLASSSLWSSMIEKENNIQVPFPWEGMNDKLYGMRTGELIIIKAAPKIGKTQILRELSYHIKSTTKHNVGLIYLEETLKRIGLGLCSFYLNRPLQIPTTQYTLEELREAHDNILGDDRFYIFDPKAPRNVDNICTKIRHFVKAYDCKFIFLDHISMLTYDSQEEQERRLLDRIISNLKDLTVELNICIIAVQHVNDEGKTRGSRAAYQLCDALLDLSRKKLSQDAVEANTTILTIEENRISGDSGIACRLFYDRDTGRMSEVDSEMNSKIDSKIGIEIASDSKIASDIKIKSSTDSKTDSKISDITLKDYLKQ